MNHIPTWLERMQYVGADLNSGDQALYRQAEADELRSALQAALTEVDYIKQVEFPSRVQKVSEGWRSKVQRLEAELAMMKAQYVMLPVGWVPAPLEPDQHMLDATVKGTAAEWKKHYSEKNRHAYITMIKNIKQPKEPT